MGDEAATGPPPAEPVEEPAAAPAAVSWPSRGWRVAYVSGLPSGDVLVRAGPSLKSIEVAVLHFGDVVTQAGPQVCRDNLIRMPIEGQRGVTGWVTVDATDAGGPVFFKECPLAEAQLG